MNPSLEDERRALLEQIEASRAVYRRMLVGEDKPRTAPRSLQGVVKGAGSGARSAPVQWMMDNPLWVAGGVALLVWAAPRLLGKGKAAARRRERARAEARARQAQAPSGTGRALLTAAVLLLRNPERLRAAARVAGSVWQWLQRQRRLRSEHTITMVTPTARIRTRQH